MNVKKKHNCEFYHSKIEKYTHFPQKVYRLSNPRSCDSEFRILISVQKMCPLPTLELRVVLASKQKQDTFIISFVLGI